MEKEGGGEENEEGGDGGGRQESKGCQKKVKDTQRTAYQIHAPQRRLGQVALPGPNGSGGVPASDPVAVQREEPSRSVRLSAGIALQLQLRERGEPLHVSSAHAVGAVAIAHRATPPHPRRLLGGSFVLWRADPRLPPERPSFTNFTLTPGVCLSISGWSMQSSNSTT